MKSRLVLSASALGAAALLLIPAPQSFGFSKIGGSLNTNRRHHRLFDNFADGATNNNVTPQSQYPGYTGAEMATWKGFAEWGSGPHGDGSGDPTQGNIGDGGGNFDAFWAGNAENVGTSNRNVTSALSSCGGGTLAFTETPISNGWRIRVCDNWTWADGPGNINSGQFDLQGVMCHEFGHALGLGHTFSGPTMQPSISSGNESARSIEADDIAGLQCVYGVASATKPVITATSTDLAAGVITIIGSNFDPLDNEIWFTPADITNASNDPIVKAQGIASKFGGTRITVAIPAGAGPGDIAVKQATGSTDGSTLSNAFPTDLATGDPTLACSEVRNGSGANPSCYSSVSSPLVGGTWIVQVDGSSVSGATFSFINGYLSPDEGTMLGLGELLIDISSPKLFSNTNIASGGVDTFNFPIPNDPTLAGVYAATQGGVFGAPGTLCNAIDIVSGF